MESPSSESLMDTEVNIYTNIFIGSEVAIFVAKHFIKELKKLESFKRKDYRLSLQECFLKMDTLMLTKEGKKELSKIASAGRLNGSSDPDGGSSSFD
jgi:hypothetical protein